MRFELVTLITMRVKWVRNDEMVMEIRYLSGIFVLGDSKDSNKNGIVASV